MQSSALKWSSRGRGRGCGRLLLGTTPAACPSTTSAPCRRSGWCERFAASHLFAVVVTLQAGCGAKGMRSRLTFARAWGGCNQQEEVKSTSSCFFFIFRCFENKNGKRATNRKHDNLWCCCSSPGGGSTKRQAATAFYINRHQSVPPPPLLNRPRGAQRAVIITMTSAVYMMLAS